jgi:Tol biopolymer transport system component
MKKFNINKKMFIFFCLLLIARSPIKAGELGVGKFLFSGQVGKGFEIFVVNDDGTDEKQITSTEGKASEPKWSPDGESFAFLNNDQLELASPDGKKIKEVKYDKGVIQDFDWSPDGKKIVFNSYVMPVSTAICIEDLSKNETRRISSRKIWCGNLVWSPDGMNISFVENNDEFGDQIVVLDSDSGKEVLKTDFKDDIKVPMPNQGDGYLDADLLNVGWTGDSKKIHFESFGGECWNYFLTLSTGKWEKWGAEGDKDLCWPIKGETTAFCGGSAPEVYSADLQGGNRRQLTPDGHYSGHPLLIDEETKIAYLSNRGIDLETIGGLSIFVMNLDGSSQKRISKIKMEEPKSKYSWHFFKD